MKNYFTSIDKTIRNFDKLEEEIIIRSIDTHENQFISQEENWTSNQTRKACLLWNLFIEQIEKKYPHLVE